MKRNTKQFKKIISGIKDVKNEEDSKLYAKKVNFHFKKLLLDLWNILDTSSIKFDGLNKNL